MENVKHKRDFFTKNSLVIKLLVMLAINVVAIVPRAVCPVLQSLPTALVLCVDVRGGGLGGPR